jgi:leucyl-tRNA synthetase
VSKETYRCPEHNWLFPGELIGSEKEGWRCPHCSRPVEIGRVEKMSKSKKNIVDPEDLINRYGADTARLFTLFAAPPEKDLEWSDQGVEGAYRFLTRIWRFVGQHRDLMRGVNSNLSEEELPPELREIRRVIHKTIKKVSDDINARFHFNTAIAAIMELLNTLSAATQDERRLKEGASLFKGGLEAMIVLLSPFVPHIANELWERLGHVESLDRVPWPTYSEAALEEEKLLIVVQVNGKVRGRITVAAEVDQKEIESEALQDQKVRSFLDGKKVQKIIHVPRRLVNIVVEG